MGNSITAVEYLYFFLRSREVMEVSPGTLQFYRVKLGKFLGGLNPDTAQRQDIETFLLQFKNPGNRHAYYRAIRTFYNWREQSYSLPSPMKYMKAPRLPKLILPSLTREQVIYLIDCVQSNRNKAIIAIFSESGLRLGELESIRLDAIDWASHTIRIMGKGRKEGLAPFGKLTEQYLKAWLNEHIPDGNIWGINRWGIIAMLRRLESETGITCNPHTFRRTFACLLRKAGLDTMTIKDLGRWESIEMVQRYTRSVNFQDNMKFYQAVMG